MSWKETETSWIDELTGLEWEKELKWGISQYDAEKWAASQGKRLPTQNEFIEAEKHRIRRLEGFRWHGYWFWSSTPYPGSPGNAYAFIGSSGNTDDSFSRYYSYDDVAARLVSQAPHSPEASSEVIKARIKALLTHALDELEKLK